MAPFVIILLSAGAMFAAMGLLAPLAHRVGLVDTPDAVRKLHSGSIPLIGGPALLIALLVPAITFDLFATHTALVLMGICTVTVLLGALDDRFELSAGSRLLVQLMLAGISVFMGGVAITHLGDLAGTGSELPLGWLSPWITIAAMAAAMNAFNMLDGTDGQTAGISLIAVVAFALGALLTGSPIPLAALALIGALPVFLAFNLAAPDGRLPKSFLGDSGAMLLGLLVGWLAVSSAQSPHGWLRPVTVLWLCAIPLFDTLFVMSYRMLHGRSPLSPDRNHVHHLLHDLGLSRHAALAVVLSTAAAFSAAGLILEVMKTPELVAFLVLFGCFLAYMGGALHLHRRRPVELRLSTSDAN